MTRLQRRDMEDLSGHLLLKLLEVADVAFDFTGRNRHSFNRLFLVQREGKDESYILNHRSLSRPQKLLMKAGQVHFMPCDMDLQFRFQPDMRFISLHFNLEIFESFDIFRGYTECTALRMPPVIRQIAAIINGAPGIQSMCLLQGLTFQIASQFILPIAPQLNFARMAEKYQALFRYIRESGDAQTTVGELAERMELDRDTLSREFSRDCGIPLKKYLLREILRRAEKLLIEPGISIREAAKMLNFTNEFYFSRFFKTNTGNSPRDYRQRFRDHCVAHSAT